MTGVHYQTGAEVVLAFLCAAGLVWLAGRLVHRLVGGLEIDSEHKAAIQERAKRVMRALTLLAYGVAAAASVSLALRTFGIQRTSWSPEALADWLLLHGVNIIVIIVGSTIVVRALHLAIDHLQFKIGLTHAKSDLEWQRRATTITGLLQSLVTVAIGFVAVMMLLQELSVDIRPILAGAGIAGLAIGFGAQNLVRDVISGFFLILEDQVRVGDIAKINGVGGTVEQINLRTIVLRDGEGAVQVFPNGTIATLANMSKIYAYAVVDARVAYNEHLDRVIATIHEIGASMQTDPDWGALLLAPLDVPGVESIADGFSVIRIRLKTLPLNQSRVANELRRCLVTTFVARGIRPYAG
ncbi:MAG TPA: mechanosensitive ion channel domain-containing protein [Vicinamibacterales bacterium]|nr:mechanosensitive ion channel domain-containing protein [Vicinamibacterales bacterium]